MPADRGIAIFGGTFDPIHFGHLRSALEVREALRLESIRFIPSYIPPHRVEPLSTPAQRMDMLRIATRDVEGFEVDDRELRREGKSYAIDTLRSLREELGDEVPLITLMGFDSYRFLYEWREWQHLLDYAHVLVMARPGYGEDTLGGEMKKFSRGRLVDEPLCLHSEPNGLICKLELTQIDVSATKIREIVASGRSPAFMLPGEVIQYIYENGLYGATR